MLLNESTRGQNARGDHASRTCQLRDVVPQVAIRTEYLHRVRRSHESMCEARNCIEELESLGKQQGVTALVIDPVSLPPILKAHGLHTAT